MRLANRFKDEDKQRIWGDHPFCALCQSNDNCSVHHIYGTISSSIFNGIMLCHSCHKKADGHNQSVMGDERRIGYLEIAFRKAYLSGHEPTDKDKKFLEIVHEDFLEISLFKQN